MILQFDMEITHVPSRDNVIADALSRQYERWKVDHWWRVNAQTAKSVTSLIAEELDETRKMEIRMAEDHGKELVPEAERDKYIRYIHKQGRSDVSSDPE